MTSSTENMGHPESEFSRGFTIAMVVLTIATLVLFAFLGREENSDRFRYVSPRFAWAPYAIVAGNTISQGLSQFSRAEDEPVHEGAKTMVFIGLVVFYICVPTVLLFTWRERTLRRRAESPRGQEGIGYAFLVSAGLLFLFIFIATLGGAVSQRLIYRSLVSAQSVQENKDQLVNTLNEVMWRLRQHRALPASLGGGEGSYDGFTLPPELSRTEDGTITLDIVPDDVTITAMSAPYEGSSVGVIYTPTGITSWTFEGLFR